MKCSNHATVHRINNTSSRPNGEGSSNDGLWVIFIVYTNRHSLAWRSLVNSGFLTCCVAQRRRSVKRDILLSLVSNCYFVTSSAISSSLQWTANNAYCFMHLKRRVVSLVSIGLRWLIKFVIVLPVWSI